MPFARASRTHVLLVMVACLCALPLVNCGGGNGGGGGGGGGVPATCGCQLPGAVGAGGIVVGTTMTAAEIAECEDVFAQVNAERVNRGLAALLWHAPAGEIAYQHSIYQESIGMLTHDGPGGCVNNVPPGTDCLQMRLTTGGIAPGTYSSWGENVAQGQADAAAVMCGAFSWMLSTGHCNNILDTGFTHIGIAMRIGIGGPYWTQVFLKIP